MINDNIFIFGWSNPLRDYAINSMDNWPVLAHCILQINNKPDKSRLFIKLCGGVGVMAYLVLLSWKAVMIWTNQSLNRCFRLGSHKHTHSCKGRPSSTRSTYKKFQNKGTKTKQQNTNFQIKRQVQVYEHCF